MLKYSILSSGSKNAPLSWRLDVVVQSCKTLRQSPDNYSNYNGGKTSPVYKTPVTVKIYITPPTPPRTEAPL